MKTNKFRVWDKNKKEIRKVTGINWYDEYLWVDETPMSGDKLPIESTPLMQFTGFTDKNGKEIYDGDIVTVRFSDGSGYDNPVEVSFENGSFWAGMGYLNDVKIIEVVGNIFQNPELLIKNNK